MAKAAPKPEFTYSGAQALSLNGIMTREQLALALGVHVDTVARWEEDGNFPHRKIGRTTLYDVAAIKEWINTKE